MERHASKALDDALSGRVFDIFFRHTEETQVNASQEPLIFLFEGK